VKTMERLFLLLLIAISAAAFGQSDAQKSFDSLKTLAGSWQGVVTTSPKQADIDGKIGQITLRVTSMGNAIVHEAHMEGRPDDPLTMIYMDGDRLMLTHYCDAGNRPRMVAKAALTGNTVEFELLDVAGRMQYGHMHHSVFNTIDPNHHTEDWTFMVGDKPILAHFDLYRAK
jgi:hypothetical protein